MAGGYSFAGARLLEGDSEGCDMNGQTEQRAAQDEGSTRSSIECLSGLSGLLLPANADVLMSWMYRWVVIGGSPYPHVRVLGGFATIELQDR